MLWSKYRLWDRADLDVSSGSASVGLDELLSVHLCIGYRLLEEFIRITPAEVLMWSWKQHLVELLLLDAQKPGAQGLVAGPEDPGTGVGSVGAPVASGGPGHFVCAQLPMEPVLCAKSYAGLSE